MRHRLSIKFNIIKPSPENRVENFHDPGSGKDVFLKHDGKIRSIREQTDKIGYIKNKNIGS